MNKKTILSILAILIIPLLVFFCLTWNKDTAVANTNNLPKIIKFSSSMCLECKQVEGIFKEILPKYKDKVAYTSVMVDNRKDMENNLIKKYKITLVPTVVMLNSDGSKAQVIEGAVSKEEYENCIKGLK